MAQGTVKWFNPTKGYGFIQPQGGGGKDVVVHISAVERAGLSTLKEGETVEYEIERNHGQESAANLKVKGRLPPAAFAARFGTARNFNPVDHGGLSGSGPLAATAAFLL